MLLSPYERMIARRYLLPGSGERFIVLVASISVVAVTLGVAALIIVMSVMNGFRAELFDKSIGLNGHAVIQGYDGRLADWRRIAAMAQATPGVTQVRPLIEQPLMAGVAGRVEGALVRGMRAPDIATNTAIAANVKAGRLDSLVPGSSTVAIGSELAKLLGTTAGGEISLIAPDGEVTPFGTVPRIVTYRVGAVFEMGIYDFDKMLVVMPIEDAQALLAMGDTVGMVEVRTTDPDAIGATMAPLVPKVAGEAVITDWRQLNAALFEALALERVVMFVILSIIILVAVFNILSSLIMLVRAKTRDIAILRTMGASRNAMLRIFMTVGTIIGATGTIAGLILGFVVLHFRQAIVNGVQALTGAPLWDASIRMVTELPSRPDPVEIGSIVAMALLFSFLATLYPAMRAATTDPVQVLRYE